MKVKGFLKDVTGADRVTKVREENFKNASSTPIYEDPINEVAKRLHPGKIDLVLTEIREASITAKTFKFEPVEGKLPIFSAGQYMVLDFEINGSYVSRPYSISSAPVSTLLEKPFVEITVRKSKGDGFICDYLYNEVKVGDKFKGNVGLGQFYYEPLRDAKYVVALAGGSGITPFASMAKQIAAGKLDCDLTILYGSASSKDIILKDELTTCEGKKVHIVPIISGDEPEWKGERGFISADIIKKYSHKDTTYFVCGPQVMYTFVHGELDKLKINPRRIRFEVFGQARDISKFPGYPVDMIDKEFKLTLVRGIHKDIIPCKAKESIAIAIERAGIKIETGCRSGECGFCRSKLISGQVYVCPVNDGRRAEDKEFNYIHACATYPLSDLEVKIPII